MEMSRQSMLHDCSNQCPDQSGAQLACFTYTAYMYCLMSDERMQEFCNCFFCEFNCVKL